MAKRTKVNFKRELAKTTELNTELAAPDVGSVIQPTRQSVANLLTPSYLGSLLLSADQGDSTAYYTLASEILEREPHLVSVLNTRTLAVTGRPIKIESASDSKQDKTLADAVYKLMRKPEIEGLLTDLMAGVYYGFSAVEIIWNKQPSHWSPTQFNWIDPRHFQWSYDLKTPLIKTNDNTGIPLQPGKFITHAPKVRAGIPLQIGLLRPLALCYAAKRFTVQQLLIFLETMGIPVRLGKFPSHLADKKAELLSACRRIGTDAAAVIPTEMEIQFLESKSAGTNSDLFLANLEYWDKTISKVVLGASMAVDQGSSRAQAQVHDGVRTDLRDADARAIAATINRDLVKPYIDYNFGEQENYPQVVIDCTNPEDSKSLIETVKVFVNLGGEVEMSSLRDRLGLPEPSPNSVLLKPESSNTANSPQPETAPQRTSLSNRLVESARATPDISDEIDELVDSSLSSDWQEILNPVVGETIRLANKAANYDDLIALLNELKSDKGDKLDISKLVDSLAAANLKARGLGDQAK